MMRELVLTEAARVGMSVEFIEETEAEGILKYRTLNLPLLFIGEEQVAAVNLPSQEGAGKFANDCAETRRRE